MELKDKLDIFLITYNRCEELQDTLNELLSENSPIKDYSIKIIDNNSTDDTYNIVQLFRQKYSNLSYEKNKYNIGGNANIMKAFYEAEKEYVWVLADNDHYCWDSWHEVEKAINDNIDAIMVSTFLWPEVDIIGFYNQGTFLPGVIYKTSNIDDTVMGNMAYNISNMFPHVALFAKLMNEKKNISVVTTGIVEIGNNISKRTRSYTYTRGYTEEAMHPLLKDMTWYAGYANSLYLIKDKKVRNYIATHHRMNGPCISSISAIISNSKKELYMLMSMFSVLAPMSRVWFLLKVVYAYLFSNIFFVVLLYRRVSGKGEYETRYQIRILRRIKITFSWRKVKREKNNRLIK